MDKRQYEEDLKRRQEEHLRAVEDQRMTGFWQPCQHDSCPSCVGTGIKMDGSLCIHHLYCSCPKCSPQYGTGSLDVTPNYATSITCSTNAQ